MGIGLTLPTIDHRPSFPEGYSPGVGIIGCRAIVKNAHLKAYGKFGVNVVGVHDILPEATRGVREQFGVYPTCSRASTSSSRILTLRLSTSRRDRSSGFP